MQQEANLKFPAEIRRLVTRRSDLSVCVCANVVRLRVLLVCESARWLW